MGSIVIDNNNSDFSLERLFKILEDAPEFYYYKTSYVDLATALQSPESKIQHAKTKLCCGEMSYNSVVYFIIEEWVSRLKEHATVDALLAALYHSKWDPLADYLSSQLQFNEISAQEIPASLDSSKIKTWGSIQYDESHILGKGSFGTIVFRGSWNQRNVAVKRLICENANEDKLTCEINTLLDYDSHDNVVNYYCMEKGTGEVPVMFIALELCDVTLKNWVEDKTCISVALTPIDILRQTTKGITFLHEKKIVHRDIKPENILLLKLSRNEVRVKICDFGISRRLPLDRTSITLRTNSGTAGWMAPELLEHFTSLTGNTIKYKMSTATDIFSLGCVFYYVITDGQHPFGKNQISIQNNVLHYNTQILLTNQSIDYIEHVSLILKMISKKPKSRPPGHAILHHHIFWSKKTALQFLVAVSNATDRPVQGSQVAACIDSVDDNIVLKHYWMPDESAGWIRFVCPAVKSFVSGVGCRRKPYFGGLISELLKAIRNMQSHYVTLPVNVQSAVGLLPEPFLDYFLKRFPMLLDIVWITFEAIKGDKSFAMYDYYCPDYDFMSKNNSESQMQLLENFVKKHCARAFLSHLI